MALRWAVPLALLALPGLGEAIKLEEFRTCKDTVREPPPSAKLLLRVAVSCNGCAGLLPAAALGAADAHCAADGGRGAV